MAASQRADPGRRGQDHRDEADRQGGSQANERLHPAQGQPEQQHGPGSASASTAIVRSKTSRSAGYGVTISGLRAPGPSAGRN